MNILKERQQVVSEKGKFSLKNYTTVKSKLCEEKNHMLELKKQVLYEKSQVASEKASVV